MARTKGGTRMYCPNCGQISVCASIPYRDGKQLCELENEGLWYFARSRECQECGGEFKTVEIEAFFLERYSIRSDEIDQIIKWRRKDLEDEFKKTIEEASGATETVLSWGIDLKLKIESIERSIQELRALHSKIELAADRYRFLKTSKD